MAKITFELAKYPAHLQKLCKHPAPPLGPIKNGFKRKLVDYRSLYSITEADIPELFEIAGLIDKTVYSGPDTEKYHYAPAHAWAVLGQMGCPDMLSQILDALNHIEWSCVGFGMEGIENCLVQSGSEAFDQLIQAFLDETRHDETRLVILDALVGIQKDRPEYRERLIQTLVNELSRLQIGRRQFHAGIVEVLLDLDARESLPLIEKAYTQGSIDPEYCGLLESIQESFGKDAVYDAAVDQLENDLEEISAVIYDLDIHEEFLPKKAILTARKHRDLIIPSLIQIVRQATAYARNNVITDGKILFAVHLLAEFQAGEALPYVMESLSITTDQAWDLYIDALYESMPGILYRLMGNDVDDYDRIIRDSKTPMLLRTILLSSLPFLIKYETLSREKHVSLLHDYLRLGIDEFNEKFVTDVICGIPNGDASFLPPVKEAFEKGLVDPETRDWTTMESLLLDAHSEYDNVLHRVKSDFSDAIAELKQWFRPDEPKQPLRMPNHSVSPRLDSFDSAFSSPQSQSTHKVGRNDPCPCGSGKKYKKCCMDD